MSTYISHPSIQEKNKEITNRDNNMLTRVVSQHFFHCLQTVQQLMMNKTFFTNDDNVLSIDKEFNVFSLNPSVIDTSSL